MLCIEIGKIPYSGGKSACFCSYTWQVYPFYLNLQEKWLKMESSEKIKKTRKRGNGNEDGYEKTCSA